MSTTATTTADLLAVDSVSKQFGTVRALDGVSLSLRAGEVHGIVGENGAGKSTLMKILSGVERPTSGRVLLEGAATTFRTPAEAQRAGIAMIHQELNLIDELSVAANIFLGREKHRLGFVDSRWAHRNAADVLESLNCPINPAARVRDLSLANKQMVEIAKAVSTNASVVIMDEPTAVLTRREVDALFGLIGRLKAKGVAIVYISHILSEVVSTCDRVTVMRDGKVVETLDRQRVQEVGERGLATLMVGRPMGDHFPPRNRPDARIAFEVRNLNVTGKVHDATFAIRAGEVLGFAGLIGAGRTELAEAIVGVRRRSSGEIFINGDPVKSDTPGRAARDGIAYLSEDRKGTGLTLGMGIAENTTMVSLKKYARPFISRRGEEAATRHYVNTLRIKIGHPRDDVATLSGGNQQKVALAKWLEVSPKVFIIDEPTRGVDVGAKEQIYAQIRALTAAGMACMLISSELNEVIGLSNRVAVMRGGRIVATMDSTDATEQKIMFHAAGVTN
ncbi:MAG TPA: sugar ABC transporter ATP-binding protein [Tepidisphaeraceae bacterium]|jgi:ribose transport system ATP-binding protein|nr:sugar ABC transporter ATP-binding protein [Tepidisphaeraceae bacterium]